MSEIHALAARQARGKLGPLAYDPGPLADEQVEIDVHYCGICHSDLSMLNNDWQITQYPFVPGHEAIGTDFRHGARRQVGSHRTNGGAGLERRQLPALPPVPHW